MLPAHCVVSAEQLNNTTSALFLLNPAKSTSLGSKTSSNGKFQKTGQISHLQSTIGWLLPSMNLWTGVGLRMTKKFLVLFIYILLEFSIFWLAQDVN